MGSKIGKTTKLFDKVENAWWTFLHITTSHIQKKSHIFKIMVYVTYIHHYLKYMMDM